MKTTGQPRATAPQTNGQISPDFLRGLAESGTWTPTVSSNLPLLTRTSAQNTTEEFIVPLQIPAKSASSKGIKITSIDVAYSINTADTGDDFQVRLTKRSVPANGSAPSTVTVIAGDNVTADYDSNHNTAAKRVVDTGAPQSHTLTMTVPTGDQAYVADGETHFINLYVIEADNAAGALAVVVKDIVVNYTEVLW